MRSLHRYLGLVAACAVLASGCEREPQFESGRIVQNGGQADPVEGGAVSTAPVAADAPSPAQPSAVPRPYELDWSPLELPKATVEVSCQLEYQELHDEQPLTDFSRDGLREALARCAERGIVRVHYRGRIDGGFASLIERLTFVADALHIDKRVLDLDSTGGQVEDGIRAGDFIAESHWSIWVREGAICHSACVFILAAGDVRMIAGQVGIHRIIRMSSTATTRAQLNDELNVVYRRVRDYFQRNGAAPAVVDLMMAVPNRGLRLLSRDELQLYGLDGPNPAQDDLDRLQLMRKCGQEFVARRDSFIRAFERHCKLPHSELDEINDCGLAMRAEFGFPDSACPAESPFAEFDVPGKVVGDPVTGTPSGGGSASAGDDASATATRDDDDSVQDEDPRSGSHP
jgi:hypothetical protein